MGYDPMTNLILVASGWEQRVRDKLGVPSSYLSDSAIQQPDIINVAEANIIEIIPNYSELTGTQKMYLEAAVICECAILLCPSMPSRLPQRESSPHFSKEANIDWFGLQDILKDERNMFLGKINGNAVPGIRIFGLIQQTHNW